MRTYNLVLHLKDKINRTTITAFYEHIEENIEDYLRSDKAREDLSAVLEDNSLILNVWDDKILFSIRVSGGVKTNKIVEDVEYFLSPVIKKYVFHDTKAPNDTNYPYDLFHDKYISI